MVWRGTHIQGMCPEDEVQYEVKTCHYSMQVEILIPILVYHYTMAGHAY